MTPIEEPWTAAFSDGYSSSSSTTTTTNKNTSESDCSPTCARWGSVKTWMFGHMLASSFAKVSLDGSATSSRASSDAGSSSDCKAVGTNDWDVCYNISSVKPSVSASSSSSTLCADVDEAERIETTAPLTTITTTTTSANERVRFVFDLVRVIGSGSYGTVYLSRVRGSQTLVAIKSVNKRQLAQRTHAARDAQRLRTERLVLSDVCDHPFITSLLCSFETPAAVHFVLEYCAGGDLYFLLEQCPQHRLCESDVAFYAASIALALQHVHARGVVYRDLKPENVLVDASGFVRLADFGFARPGVGDATEQRCTTFCGSADYIAPEVVCGKGYGIAADVWSFGCVVFELLTGFPPFYCPSNRTQLFRNIETAAVTFPPHLSPQVCDLLTGLLHKDAAQRLTLDAVFAHPFFQAIDWYALATKQVVPPRVPTLASPLDTRNFETQFTQQRVDGSVAFVEREVLECQPAGADDDEARLFDDFDWCCDDAASRW